MHFLARDAPAERRRLNLSLVTSHRLDSIRPARYASLPCYYAREINYILRERASPLYNRLCKRLRNPGSASSRETRTILAKNVSKISSRDLFNFFQSFPLSVKEEGHRFCFLRMLGRSTKASFFSICFLNIYFSSSLSLSFFPLLKFSIVSSKLLLVIRNNHKKMIRKNGARSSVVAAYHEWGTGEKNRGLLRWRAFMPAFYAPLNYLVNGTRGAHRF